MRLIFFVLVSLVEESWEIQTRAEVVVNSSTISSSNSSSSRQNFYNVHFQYRPDFGGPWQQQQQLQPQLQWNRPLLSPPRPQPQSQSASSFPFNKPIVGIGSATPVKFPPPPNSVQFPGPVHTYTISNISQSQNRDKAGGGTSVVKTSNTCSCGVVPSKLERITGGSLSKEKAWPWMAAIVFIGSDKPFWFCGASLINDRYLLTAAHCQRTIRRRGLGKIRVLLGSNGIPKSSSSAQLFEISDIKTHPLYRQSVEEYDIGLIRLSKKVSYSDEISPICLTQLGSPYSNKMATVAGWGSVQYGDTPPTELRDVELRVVTNTKCEREYLTHYATRITSPMLCAWLPGKDSCQGDSGGPLFLQEKGSYTQIGIVSFGPPQCGETTIPGVYTRIASTIRWIKANTRDATYCDGSFESNDF